MLGLGATASPPAGLAGLLSRYASGDAGLGRTGWGRADRPSPPPPPSAADRPPAVQASDGVVAQISQMARSLFQQMKQDGVAAQSIDLELNLSQLAVSGDGQGNRTVQGRSLTVDLHLQAQQGTVKTDQGDVSVQQLDVQLEMTQTDVLARESRGAAAPAAPDLAGDGKTAGVADVLDQLAHLLGAGADARAGRDSSGTT